MLNYILKPYYLFKMNKHYKKAYDCLEQHLPNLCDANLELAEKYRKKAES